MSINLHAHKQRDLQMAKAIVQQFLAEGVTDNRVLLTRLENFITEQRKAAMVGKSHHRRYIRELSTVEQTLPATKDCPVKGCGMVAEKTIVFGELPGESTLVLYACLNCGWSEVATEVGANGSI